MRHLSRIAAFLLMPLWLGACSGLGFSDTPAKLPIINYYFVDLGRSYDRQVQIAPTGDMIISERKGAAPDDTRNVPGHLTPAQTSAVLAAFKGWKQLKPNYPGDFTPLIQIKFDDHQVEVNNIDRAPPEFKAAKAALDKIASEVLPPWPAAATRPQ